MFDQLIKCVGLKSRLIRGQIKAQNIINGGP